jgi:hypothetical protein
MDFMLKYDVRNDMYVQHPLLLRENECKALCSSGASLFVLQTFFEIVEVVNDS